MKIRIETQPNTPDRYRRALSALTDVHVAPSTEDRISVEGKIRPLVLLPRPQPGGDVRASASHLAGVVPRGAVGLVVAGSIPDGERDALEAVGLSWCDGRGAIHLAWPGTLVHIDRAGRRPRRDSPAVVGLGPAGVRAVQVLASSHDQGWTVNRLAKEASISVGQAHNVFKTLEAERLVRATGRGPQQRREIDDRRAVVDWLASVDQSRRKPDAAASYLYAPTHGQLLQRFAERAAHAGVPYAVTGSAGCDLLGVPVLNKILVTHIRVGVLKAADALAHLGLERLDAEDAGRGMNLELWSDTGELGTYGAKEVGGVRVAPPVRVWLDLAREGGRSADAAQVFREKILERA